MIRKCVLWVIAVALAAPLPAAEPKAAPEKKAPEKKAAPKDKKQPEPIHVWADRIRYVQEQSLAYINDNATVIKGDLRIDADTIIADLDQKTNEFKKMTATGNVRVNTVEPITQRTTERPPLKPVSEGRSAECDKATYDAATGIVVLQGTPDAQPVVRFGKDEARADLITFDRNKNIITFEGRVVLTAILPVKGEEKAPPGKETPPKASQ